MLYLAYALLTLHMFVGIFLIGLILLQRGRGGGLAGAFGGMGGQSAFGTKAGDIFTRITIVVAVIWILLACVCILVVNAANKGRFKPGAADTVIKASADDKDSDGGAAAGDAKLGNAADGEAKAIVLPSPDKTDPASEQPKGAEKKPDGTDDKKDGAAEAKKPADTEAKPAAATPDAAKDKAANDKDKEKPATTENSDAKKPE